MWIVLHPRIKRLESASGMQDSAGCLKSKEELICKEKLISSYSDDAQLARRITFGVSEEPKNLTYGQHTGKDRLVY